MIFNLTLGFFEPAKTDDDDGNGGPQNKRQEETQQEEYARKLAERRGVHDDALGRHSESVTYIKECIARNAANEALDEWNRIGSVDQIALWLAPSKGGCFTTAERAALRDPRPAKDKNA
jgi:hypothetical protein